MRNDAEEEVIKLRADNSRLRAKVERLTKLLPVAPLPDFKVGWHYECELCGDVVFPEEMKKHSDAHDYQMRILDRNRDPAPDTDKQED